MKKNLLLAIFCVAISSLSIGQVEINTINLHTSRSQDISVLNQNIPHLLQVNKPYSFNGSVSFTGNNAVSAMNLNYSINGGDVKTQTISGLNGRSSAQWSMDAMPFTPIKTGVYTIKYWINNINGSNTGKGADTLITKFLAVDSVLTKQALYEEYTGQSCVFCMVAAPNMDSVYNNNISNSNIIRYHVPIPARDFMYTATTSFVNTRESYYGVNSAPDGYMDGSSLYPSTYQQSNPGLRYSSTTIQDENAVGSPFKITITKARYNLSADSFEVTANITAYADFAAGLIGQVALTIDSITYQYDLSMDDPASEFQKCVCVPGSKGGSGSCPDCPDYYYDFTLKFPHVAEEMFPTNGAGTKLAAFTSGQTQTLSFAWKRNHPWGTYDKPLAQRDSDYYDSSLTGQFVVFVQTNTAIASQGIPAKYVFQSASAPINGISVDAGVENISNGVSFKLYPNPAVNNANIEFNLTKNQHVAIEAFDLLGENVYSNNEGILSSGQHTLSINCASLKNGIYLVRLITDDGATIQKLVIQR